MIATTTPTFEKQYREPAAEAGVVARMGTAVSVHWATQVDAATIANISRRGFAAAHQNAFIGADLARYLAQTFQPTQIAAEISNVKNLFLLGEVAGTVVGTARLSRTPPPAPLHLAAPVELSRFYLLPEWVGQGIGAALMLHALGTAVSTGHQNCWLGVWEGNHRAINFYRRWGFQPVGTHTLPVGQSCPIGLVMTRPL